MDLIKFAPYDTSGGKGGKPISQLDDKVPFLIICVLKTDESERLTVGVCDFKSLYIEKYYKRWTKYHGLVDCLYNVYKQRIC